jgi:hypothetical protein
MEEQTFMDGGGTTVTSSRIVINGKTFATRNVGSVAMSKQNPSRGLPFIVGLIGLACLAGPWQLGLTMLVVAGVIFWVQRPRYSLMMMAGGGEVLALQSTNGALVQQVHDAVAQAIAVR